MVWLKPVNIIARDLQDAWFQALDKTLEMGRQWTVARGSYEGQRRWELDWVQIHITGPHVGYPDCRVESLIPDMPSHLAHIPPPTTVDYINDYVGYMMEDQPLKENEQYCYDPETEVLTELGWKNFPELGYNDRLATLNPVTYLLEYQFPDLVAEFKNTKPFYHWQSRQIDHLVTEGHNTFVSKDGIEDFSFQKVQDVQRSRFRVKRDCFWKGKHEKFFVLPSIEYKNSRYKGYGGKKKIPMKLWLRFLGYWIADGSLRNQNGYVVVISKRKEDERRRILREVREIFPNAFEYDKDILISNKQLFYYLLPLGKAGDKYIPDEFLCLSSDLLEELIQSMYSCDGNNKKHRDGLTRYSTKSKRLADQVQEICLKTNRAANVSFDSGIYRVNIVESKEFMMPHLLKKRNCENIGVRDVPVFCAQVPNHTLYVRRNGNAMWSGNTYGQRIKSQMDKIIERYKKGFGSNQECIAVARPEDVDLPDPPCLRQIDTRIVAPDGRKRGEPDQLHFFPYFRSCDLWGGFPSNLAAIALMQQWMAEQIGVIPGEMIYTSKGLHLYDHAWDVARVRVGKEDQGGPRGTKEDQGE